jgi:hypothetical protein
VCHSWYTSFIGFEDGIPPVALRAPSGIPSLLHHSM